MVLFLWGAFSDERTCLSFPYAADLCQRGLSQVWVPWDSRPYFTVSDLSLVEDGLFIISAVAMQWTFCCLSPGKRCFVDSAIPRQRPTVIALLWKYLLQTRYNIKTSYGRKLFPIQPIEKNKARIRNIQETYTERCHNAGCPIPPLRS